MFMQQNMIKTDAIFFDVDGTLWDSTEQVAVTWKQVCLEAGLPADHITGERMKQEFGKLMEDIAVSLFPTADRDKMIYLLRECTLRENDDLRKNPPPLYEGVRDLFIRLKERGIPVIIISNCQAGYIEVLIDSHELGPYITDHFCPGDTGLDKADNIRLAMNKYNYKAPVYVGDTAGDAASAAKAGVPFVYAAYGFGSVTDPDYSVQKPIDIAALPVF